MKLKEVTIKSTIRTDDLKIKNFKKWICSKDGVKFMVESQDIDKYCEILGCTKIRRA